MHPGLATSLCMLCLRVRIFVTLNYMIALIMCKAYSLSLPGPKGFLHHPRKSARTALSHSPEPLTSPLLKRQVFLFWSKHFSMALLHFENHCPICLSTCARLHHHLRSSLLHSRNTATGTELLGQPFLTVLCLLEKCRKNRFPWSPPSI